MSEPVLDIVVVSTDSGASRWQAVAPRGSVAGVASLRPVVRSGQGLLLRAGAVPELSLYVEPEWRRRGIGSRLLATVREQAAVPYLVADVAEGSPGRAFCLRHGFRHTGVRRHDVLTYCDVHEAWLRELIDAEHSGYRLSTWTGDLPNGSIIDELIRTPSGPGNAVLTAADTGGDLAAYAVAIVGPPAQPRARQYGPAVLPAHRGRRLGIWVNAGLVQQLREVHPHVNEVVTAAADDDHHQLATRQQLGFRFHRRTHVFELGLRSTSA
jgi:GNAT superfamily N-acetyltransferase